MSKTELKIGAVLAGLFLCATGILYGGLRVYDEMVLKPALAKARAESTFSGYQGKIQPPQRLPSAAQIKANDARGQSIVTGKEVKEPSYGYIHRRNRYTEAQNAELDRLERGIKSDMQVATILRVRQDVRGDAEKALRRHCRRYAVAAQSMERMGRGPNEWITERCRRWQ